jgi:hypothetical protein
MIVHGTLDDQYFFEKAIMCDEDKENCEYILVNIDKLPFIHYVKLIKIVQRMFNNHSEKYESYSCLIMECGKLETKIKILPYDSRVLVKMKHRKYTF